VDAIQNPGSGKDGMETDPTTAPVELKIGARELVAWASRSGDLDLSFSVGTRSVEAIRAHQRVQHSRPAGYAAEVSISATEERDGFSLTVSGRMDGLFPEKRVEGEKRVVVDEIKTTTRELERFREKEVVQHRDQARLYACLYARQNGLATIGTQLTYYRMQTGETLELVALHSIGELESFFQELVATYLAWARRMAAWRQTRDTSLANLAFPFAAYRAGQRDMAVAVYRCIRDNGQMIIQAPTGIGKTMATLFPAVKALGEGRVDRVFYLTARTTGRQVAEDALDRIRSRGGRIKSLTLTAKDRICPHPETACTPEECPYARGHYDRVGEALESLFEHDAFDRVRVAAVAEFFRVCPFEFSLDLSLWADCVVCDYNYVFDPRVYLRRFFGESEVPCALLIDEAHNLVDRSRDMFSAELTKQAVLETRRAVKADLPRIYRQLGKINRELLVMKKECDLAGGQSSTEDPPETLYPLLREFQGQAERWLARNQPADCREALLDFYFAVNTFLRVAETYDNTYATCSESRGKGLRLKLFCMDPAPQVAEVLDRCRAVVLFSATMTPVGYFRKTLGCRDDAVNLVLNSPFPPENQATLAYTAVSTLYRDRTSSRSAVSRALLALALQKRGNYLFFFPSYRYMEDGIRGFHDRFTSPHGDAADAPGAGNERGRSGSDFLKPAFP
jgi:DNA excision repair protein ERCC-2